MSVRNDPAEILRDFRHPPGGNVSVVYRQRLGLAHAEEQDKLTVQQVLACCGEDVLAVGHPGPCAIGTDMGDDWCYVVIGCRTGEGTYQVLWIGRIATGELAVALDQRASAFNVRVEVIDSRPNAQLSRDRQKAARHLAWLNWYSENLKIGVEFDEQKRIVVSYRTGIMDVTHKVVAEKRVLFPRKELQVVKEFAAGYAKPAKFLDVDKKTGQQVFRYNGPAGDHYRHAMNYFVIGADRIPAYRAGQRWEDQFPAEMGHDENLTEL
jgi:hypothetical protein